MEQCLSAGAERAAVALGLLQGTGYVHVFAFGLDHGHGGESLKQHVIGGVTVARPFGNGHVAAPLRAGAFAVTQGGRVCFPARLAQLLVDDAAGLGFV